VKVLVTGGTGFVGAALCAELVTAGHHVVVLDNNSRGDTSRLARFRDSVELIEGDIRSYDAVRRAVKGCEVVWHLAYVNGTRYFYERPDDVLEVGIKGAINTIEASLEEGVRRYVLASTSEVYGEPTEVPTSESEMLKVADVLNPRFSYGGGKLASELLTLHMAGRRGLETVIFRPHNFYGPDMGFEHVIPELTQRILSQADGLSGSKIVLPIQGDGSETRAFCHISDGARGAYLAGSLGTSNEIYHVGTEDEIPIARLASMIAKCLGIEVELFPGELRLGGARRRCPDIKKLRQLGYEPQTQIEDGLVETVEWYAKLYRRSDAVAGAKSG
jgi:nucleoside-diphosphate-sugar epimerase